MNRMNFSFASMGRMLENNLSVISFDNLKYRKDPYYFVKSSAVTANTLKVRELSMKIMRSSKMNAHFSRIHCPVFLFL